VGKEGCTVCYFVLHHHQHQITHVVLHDGSCARSSRASREIPKVAAKPCKSPSTPIRARDDVACVIHCSRLLMA
jgi:hypothetical protein